LQVADVGMPPPNLAVTALRLAGDRLVATVRNSGPQPRDAIVHVAVNTAEGQGTRNAGDAAASIGPSQVGDVMLPAPRGRWAVVSVDDPAGIQGDNARYIVLGTSTRPSVLVITSTGDLQREAFYLLQALTAARTAGGGYEVDGTGAAKLSSWDQPRVDGHLAAVLLSTKGLERRGRELIGEYVRKGGGLLIGAGPDTDGEVVADTLGEKLLTMVAPTDAEGRSRDSRTFAPADVRHPIFQPFGLGAASFSLVKFQRAAAIRSSACQTLARLSGGEPAFVECSPGQGRVLVFASDLDNRWNDFPLHATYVPFVHEVVRYLSATRSAASDYLIGDRAVSTAQVPGVISVQLGGSPRLVAVNVDPRESDASRMSPDEFRTAVTKLKDPSDSPVRLEVRQQEDRQHVWQYVLILMVAILVAETLVAKRTA
jgi:hypothetical protein